MVRISKSQKNILRIYAKETGITEEAALTYAMSFLYHELRTAYGMKEMDF